MSLDHTSSLNFLPFSTASIAAQTLSWASLIIFSNRALTEDEELESQEEEEVGSSDSRRKVWGQWVSMVSFSISGEGDEDDGVACGRREMLGAVEGTEGNFAGKMVFLWGRAEEEEENGIGKVNAEVVVVALAGAEEEGEEDED